ncbi:MAG: hypothetical protein V3U24_02805 [Candidatus Neomarinimicrobiota bacterium]
METKKSANRMETAIDKKRIPLRAIIILVQSKGKIINDRKSPGRVAKMFVITMLRDQSTRKSPGMSKNNGLSEPWKKEDTIMNVGYKNTTIRME